MHRLLTRLVILFPMRIAVNDSFDNFFSEIIENNFDNVGLISHLAEFVSILLS